MFGIGLILFLCLFVIFICWIVSFVPAGKLRKIVLAAIISFLAAYPFMYKLYPSYTKFHELCERSDRYQVIMTKAVSYPFLNRDVGLDCKNGLKFIGNQAFEGFDCVAPNTRTTTAIFRYTKTADWHSGCGTECFNIEKILVPEVRVESGYRAGFIDGDVSIVTYDVSGIHAKESSSNKLIFSDMLLLVDGVEMAFSRSYTYYPYGDGWAKILGAASGSAPSQHCKAYAEMDMRDIYKPKQPVS